MAQQAAVQPAAAKGKAKRKPNATPAADATASTASSSLFQSAFKTPVAAAASPFFAGGANLFAVATGAAVPGSMAPPVLFPKPGKPAAAAAATAVAAAVAPPPPGPKPIASRLGKKQPQPTQQKLQQPQSQTLQQQQQQSADAADGAAADDPSNTSLFVRFDGADANQACNRKTVLLGHFRRLKCVPTFVRCNVPKSSAVVQFANKADATTAKRHGKVIKLGTAEHRVALFWYQHHAAKDAEPADAADASATTTPTRTPKAAKTPPQQPKPAEQAAVEPGDKPRLRVDGGAAKRMVSAALSENFRQDRLDAKRAADENAAAATPTPVPQLRFRVRNDDDPPPPPLTDDDDDDDDDADDNNADDDHEDAKSDNDDDDEEEVVVAPVKPVAKAPMRSTLSLSEIQAKNFEAQAATVGTATSGETEVFRAKSFTSVQQRTLDDAVHFVGTCEAMCPMNEVKERETLKQLSLFEIDPATRHQRLPRAVPELCVKTYHRPSAADGPAVPAEVRPPPVLERTMAYLCSLLDNDEHAYEYTYGFVRDRSRGVRQDFTVQNVLTGGTPGGRAWVEMCVRVHEQCARFHAVSEHMLCGESEEVFSSQQNVEQLNKCLISLRQMYSDSRGMHGHALPNEAEFQAYYLLTHIDSAMYDANMLPRDIYHSPQVQFALRVWEAIDQNNYVRFFRLVRDADYIAACLMHFHFRRVRLGALRALNTACKKQAGAYAVADLERQLLCNSIDEMLAICDYYSLSVRLSDRSDGADGDSDGVVAVVFENGVIEAPSEPAPRFPCDVISRKGDAVALSALVRTGVAANTPAAAAAATAAVPVPAKKAQPLPPVAKAVPTSQGMFPTPKDVLRLSAGEVLKTGAADASTATTPAATLFPPPADLEKRRREQAAAEAQRAATQEAERQRAAAAAEERRAADVRARAAAEAERKRAEAERVAAEQRRVLEQERARAEQQRLEEQRRADALRRQQEELVREATHAARTERFEAAIARAARLERFARLATAHREQRIVSAAFRRWRQGAQLLRDRRERHFDVLRASGMAPTSAAPLAPARARVSVAGDDRIAQALRATLATRRPAVDVADALARGWLARGAHSASDALVVAAEGALDDSFGRERSFLVFVADVDGAVARRALPSRDFALPVTVLRAASPRAHGAVVLLDGSAADAERLTAVLLSIVPERVYAFADDSDGERRAHCSAAVLVVGACAESAVELLEDLENVCEELCVHYRRDAALTRDGVAWLGEHCSAAPLQRATTTLAAVALRALQVGVAPLLRHYGAERPFALPSLAFLLREYNAALATLCDQIESRCSAEDGERTRILRVLERARAPLPRVAPPALPSALALSRWLREQLDASDAVCDVLRVHFSRTVDANAPLPWNAVFAAIVDERLAPLELEPLVLSDNFQPAIPTDEDDNAADDADDDWIFVGEGDALVAAVAASSALTDEPEPDAVDEDKENEDKENEPVQPDAFTAWLRRALEDGHRGAPLTQQQLRAQQQEQHDVDDLMATFGVRDAAVAMPHLVAAAPPPPPPPKAPLPDVGRLIQMVRNEQRAWHVENARWGRDADELVVHAKRARRTLKADSDEFEIGEKSRLQMILDL